MRALLVVAVIAVLTAGCAAGASGPTGTSRAGGRIVEVTFKEFSFTPATITAKPGEKITLRFTNAGALEHEFMAGTGPVPGKGFRVDFLAAAVDTGVPSHTHPGEEHTGLGVRVAPSWYGSIDLTMPAQPGEYLFGCFVQGHYEAGMQGKLVIR